MAAVTIASQKHHHGDDSRFVTFNLTSVQDQQTLDTGFGEIDNIIATVQPASNGLITASWSSTVIGGQVRVTFGVSSTTNLIVTVFGR